MQTSTTSRRWMIGLLSSLALVPAIAQTDAWPSKPLRVIVPFPAGGGTDIVARDVTQKMSVTTKWTFVIDNKPGSGGNLGIDTAAKAPADGYSLVIGQTSNLAINPSLYSKLPFDIDTEFDPVSMLTRSTIGLAVPANFPANTLDEFIAHARKNPGKLSYGSAGQGSLTHLTMELFKLQINSFMVHIPYRGSGPATADLLSGQVTVGFPGIAGMLPQSGVVTITPGAKARYNFELRLSDPAREARWVAADSCSDSQAFTAWLSLQASSAQLARGARKVPREPSTSSGTTSRSQGISSCA